MSDEGGSGSTSGWDHSRWGGSGQDEGGWDKSAWAEASRELQEQEDSGQAPASPGADQDRQPSLDRPASRDRPAGRDRPASQERQSGQGRRQPGPDRRQSRQQAQRPDVLSDLQRWVLRSGARSVRNEISGQVRRTLGGGRAKPADIWDTATNEIPPEVGQSPECQWCPICRAARRMRESGPGLGDHLSSAGDMVAAAVSEALKSVDSVLSRPSAAGDRPKPDDWAPGGQDWESARDSWAAAHGGMVAGPEAGGETTEAENEDRPQQTEGLDEPDNRG